MIASKSPVEAGAAAQAIYKTFAKPLRSSFRSFHEERVLTEFKESCVQVWSPLRNNHAPLSSSSDFIKSQQLGKTFEMPDGWNQLFNMERFRAVEGLFDEKAIIPVCD